MGRFPSWKSPGKQPIKKRGVKRFLIIGRRAEQAKANLDPRVVPRVAPRVGPRVGPTSPPTRAPTRDDFPVFGPFKDSPRNIPRRCPRKGPRVDGRGSSVLFSPVLCSLTMKTPWKFPENTLTSAAMHPSCDVFSFSAKFRPKNARIWFLHMTSGEPLKQALLASRDVIISSDPICVRPHLPGAD